MRKAALQGKAAALLTNLNALALVFVFQQLGSVMGIQIYSIVFFIINFRQEDCEDASDEPRETCQLQHTTCPKDHFRCTNGRCIFSVYLKFI
jgi:hypothetical protein